MLVLAILMIQPVFVQAQSESKKLQCDSGQVIVTSTPTIFQSQVAFVFVANLKSGIMFQLVQFPNTDEEKFFFKPNINSAEVEISHKEFDEKLEKQAPNFYRWIHDEESTDCHNVNE